MKVSHQKKSSKVNYDSNEVPDFIDSLINVQSNNKNNLIPPIEKGKLDIIRDALTRNYPKEVLQALTDNNIRKKLVDVTLKEHGSFFKNKKDVAEYIVRECIGTGIIEKILKNDKITDVGWNGTQLSIKTNDSDRLIDGKKLNITQEYIERIIAKYAAVNDKAFNSGNPSFDGMFGNVRIAAMHTDNSPCGATLSMRVARPSLALNKNNFTKFAPEYIYELFEKIIKTNCNICISGETGSGKTELQKLLMSFIDNHERIIMIEDIQETHAKELFPDKDIFSWVVTSKKSISDLIKDALRNLPTWINVSETRGREAYDMLKAVLSGHYVITTLHSISARATPRRFGNMCCDGANVSEEVVESDIYSYFDFGIHVKKLKLHGKTIRYLSEMVEFNSDGTATTIFEQRFNNGKFILKHGDLSDQFKNRMAEKFITFNFPKDIPLEIEVDV